MSHASSAPPIRPRKVDMESKASSAPPIRPPVRPLTNRPASTNPSPRSMRSANQVHPPDLGLADAVTPMRLRPPKASGIYVMAPSAAAPKSSLPIPAPARTPHPSTAATVVCKPLVRRPLWRKPVQISTGFDKNGRSVNSRSGQAELGRVPMRRPIDLSSLVGHFVLGGTGDGDDANGMQGYPLLHAPFSSPGGVASCHRRIRGNEQWKAARAKKSIRAYLQRERSPPSSSGMSTDSSKGESIVEEKFHLGDVRESGVRFGGVTVTRLGNLHKHGHSGHDSQSEGTVSRSSSHVSRSSHASGGSR